MAGGEGEECEGRTDDEWIRDHGGDSGKVVFRRRWCKPGAAEGYRVAGVAGPEVSEMRMIRCDASLSREEGAERVLERGMRTLGGSGTSCAAAAEGAGCVFAHVRRGFGGSRFGPEQP